MMKKKVFDIAGSNIEMLGSKVEKQCKKAASKGEAAWKNAGKKVGLEIWRIESFKVKKWPKDRYGKFYKGDSYIILNTYEEKETEKLAWDLHFWLGSETSQDEAGTAAYKTVELDTALGDGPIQHREVCGYESRLFLSYFKKCSSGGIELLSGGVDSGFNHVKPEEFNPRLIHIKGRKNVRCVQVDLSYESLRSGDCFILDAGLNIYQWQGASCNQQEKVKAAQYARSLDTERKGKAEVIVIDQDDKDVAEEFWELLGGDSDSKISEDDGGDDAWEKNTDRRMFQLTDAGGKVEFNLVGQDKTMSKSKLKTEDVFIVDVGDKVYVWIGKASSSAERHKAMSYTQQYIAEYKRPAFLPITRIHEGSENAAFNLALTKKGRHHFKKSTGGPTVEQKGEMGCYLTVAEASNGCMFLNWSKSEVGGHIAYFKPTKSVPAFKFKAKGGKDELTRGTDSHKKNYYEGWCNYVKLAKEYKSLLLYRGDTVQLWHHTGTKLKLLPKRTMVDLKNIEAIAAIPGSASLFEGIKTTSRGNFLNKAQSLGAALVLPK